MSGHADAVVQAGRVEHVRIGDQHDRRGVVALLVVVVLVVVAGVAVVWRLTREEPAPPVAPLADTDLRLKDDCTSGWVVPERGDAPVPFTTRRPVDAVLATGGEVVVTVQGQTRTSVVLQSAWVEVLSRTPARPGVYLPSACQSDVVPRFFQLDLAAASPELVPRVFEGEPLTFPFRVDEVEPEQFVITALSPDDEEVAWRLHLRWTSGATEGELVLDDRGEPFRTTGIAAARRFCLLDGGSRWQPSC
ncbi:hypothetical protein [Saccharothrix texasensis]|uniref:Uncharacterized protein n=1 Tax=Saccharothrix texasensis TaxID=103734 RepID=A0A3N1HE57_9PSEU|nr:hypothetical protein [Saccharothrix texasensis]ROP40789.1 hypothetical protein EDD40_6207 [Saccharothrix texasensis]